MKVELTVTDLEPFKSILSVIQTVLEDDRVPEEVKEEYANEFKQVLDIKTRVFEQQTT